MVSLLHEASYATLATHSQQLIGHPYASVLPYVPDDAHCPIIMVSALAEHTKNLLADRRVSLSVHDSGRANVQAVARATVLGEAERIEPGELLLARYFRYQPDAEPYLALDFMFFRIRPTRLRYIAGIGKMGWLTSEDMQAARSLPIDTEQELINVIQPLAPAGLSILGVDCYGVDYRRDGVRGRRAFETPRECKGIDADFIQALIRELA